MPAPDEKTVAHVSKKVRTHLMRERFVAVDVETTGLQPQKGARVIEVGAVAIEGKNITEEFHAIIDAGKHIPFYVQQIHGITDEMLIGQPKAKDVFPQFHSFIKGSTIMAHNATFDIRFLRYEFSHLGLEFSVRYFCTLELSRMLFPRLQNHKLETVYKHLFRKEPDLKQRHRALDDARMVARIWIKMKKGLR